ncbi:MAG TPA: hypothetical protein VLF69_06035 [Candidatus Saccharimonadales bacterium]|nr:hypothetical protein [Candidatus Saccharimonadales bacterium]
MAINLSAAERVLPDDAIAVSITSLEDGPIAPNAREVQILGCAKDYGGSRAALVVARELLAMGRTADATVNPVLTFVLAGNGKRIFHEECAEYGLSVGPASADILNGTGIRPDVKLITPSQTGGLEGWMLEQFPDAKAAALDDYPEATRRAIRHALALEQPIPLILAIHKIARARYALRFPGRQIRVVDLENSPVFDKYADQDTRAIRLKRQGELGVPDEESLAVIALPVLEEGGLEVATTIKAELAKLEQPLWYAIRWHPDDTDAAEYERMFRGGRYLDTSRYPIGYVIPAATVMGGPRSTEVWSAAAQGIDNFTILNGIPEDFSAPLVDIGASWGVYADELSVAIPVLISGTSMRFRQLREGIERCRPKGDAGRRAAAAILSLAQL